MGSAIGHPQAHSLLDEEHGPPGDHPGVDRRRPHGYDPAAEGVQDSHASGADVIERRLEPELWRTRDGPGEGAHQEIADRVGAGLRACSGRCGDKAGGDGGQGGEAASHDVSPFVVDLSSAAF